MCCCSLLALMMLTLLLLLFLPIQRDYQYSRALAANAKYTNCLALNVLNVMGNKQWNQVCESAPMCTKLYTVTIPDHIQTHIVRNPATAKASIFMHIYEKKSPKTQFSTKHNFRYRVVDTLHIHDCIEWKQVERVPLLMDTIHLVHL